MSTEELLAEVLKLPRNERARIVGEALASLEEPEDEIAAALAPELDRRSRDLSEGRVEAVDAEVARIEILEELRLRRAHRAAS